MKKLSAFLLVFAIVFATNSFDAKSMNIIIKVRFGIRSGGECNPGFGVCSIYIGPNLSAALSGQNGETDMEVINGTAELKDGKLFITAQKSVSEKGKNERGVSEIAIKENGVKSGLTIDPAVLKELGVQSMVIAPGNYSFNGNTIVFNVVGPRDASSGQATGKKKEYTGHVTLMK